MLIRFRSYVFSLQFHCSIEVFVIIFNILCCQSISGWNLSSFYLQWQLCWQCFCGSPHHKCFKMKLYHSKDKMNGLHMISNYIPNSHVGGEICMNYRLGVKCSKFAKFACQNSSIYTTMINLLYKIGTTSVVSSWRAITALSYDI